MRDERKEMARLAIEAMHTVLGDRQDDYGPPSVALARVASVWGGLLPSSPLEQGLTPRTVALMLAGMKLARLANGYHHDSVVDAIGYLLIYATLEEDE